jgi:excinuclease UvrABC helicase subunit UvrB
MSYLHYKSFGIRLDMLLKNKLIKIKTMFGKRKNFNDFMREFDSMFESMDSMFGYKPKMIFGETKTETGTDENGVWTKQTFTSEDGSTTITNFVRTDGFGSRTKTESLQDLLKSAVEEQNYEEAVKLRDEIKKMEKNKDKIESLKNELNKHVKDQDYEKAIEVRDEIKKLEK